MPFEVAPAAWRATFAKTGALAGERAGPGGRAVGEKSRANHAAIVMAPPEFLASAMSFQSRRENLPN